MNRKMIVPMIIGVIVAFYLMFWVCLIAWTQMPIEEKALIGIPAVALLFLWIHVVMERMEEIRSGEEDDLSQY